MPDAKKKPDQPPRDVVREFAETVVFVVSLVLMLKLFVVEAFVIPTGSMAETLYGYQKILTCEKCGFEFPVNCSNEVEPFDTIRRPLIGACCPNCRYRMDLQKGKAYGYTSGDRVLVLKPLYTFADPKRGDVVVFKYPVSPQISYTAQNYIKRLWGKGGETIAIWRGDLYVCPSLDYPADLKDADGYPVYGRPPDAKDLWEKYFYHSAEIAVRRFEASRRAGFPEGKDGFTIIPKDGELAMSMRRIVYDNDHQPDDLVKKGVPPRWTAGAAWTTDSPTAPKVFTHAGDDVSWVNYLHRVPRPDEVPQWSAYSEFWTGMEGAPVADRFPPGLITNFLGYNAGVELNDQRFGPDKFETRDTGTYWVGDLMVECKAAFAGAADEVVLELSEGSSRFQARFSNGEVKLVRTGAGAKDLGAAKTGISGGSHDLRFANFDDRLMVWVDGDPIDVGAVSSAPALDFNAAVGALAGATFGPMTAELSNPFDASRHLKGPEGFTLANDVLAPARIGAKGSVEVRNVKLWQDTFFTPSGGSGDGYALDTYYVQPGHYLCLGDNSAQSSDSRSWGLVPERLMLGKAVFVFFPLSRIGFIE